VPEDGVLESVTIDWKDPEDGVNGQITFVSEHVGGLAAVPSPRCT
jgi:hypothetical protein